MSLKKRGREEEPSRTSKNRASLWARELALVSAHRELQDVRVVCSCGEEVRTAATVLVAVSPVLERMLLGDFAEGCPASSKTAAPSTEDEVVGSFSSTSAWAWAPRWSIELREVSARALRAVLEGEEKALGGGVGEVLEVWAAARWMQAEGAVEACEARVRGELWAKAVGVVYESGGKGKEGEQQSAACVAVDSVMEALGESRRWSLCGEVGTCAGAVVARLWREFAERGALEALPLEALETALKGEDAGTFAVMGAGSERELLEGALAWLLHRPDAHEQRAASLRVFPLLQLSRMSSLDIEEVAQDAEALHGEVKAALLKLLLRASLSRGVRRAATSTGEAPPRRFALGDPRAALCPRWLSARGEGDAIPSLRFLDANIIEGETSCEALLVCGEKLFCGVGDRIRVWSTATWECERTLEGHRDAVFAIAMSGEKLCSGSGDSTIRVWSTVTWECERTLWGHRGDVFAIAMSGEKLFSGSWDYTIRVWSTTTWECERTLEGH